MSFSSKLQKLIKELGLNQKKVAELTGLSRSAISQYISGSHEPYKSVKRDIAAALGVQEDYFEEILPEAVIQQNEVINLPVNVAAKLMRKSDDWIKKGLQDGRFPWGYAVKIKQWSYWISSVKFSEYTGIAIPMNNVEVEQG